MLRVYQERSGTVQVDLLRQELFEIDQQDVIPGEHDGMGGCFAGIDVWRWKRMEDWDN
jgi:hypothetical protein